MNDYYVINFYHLMLCMSSLYHLILHHMHPIILSLYMMFCENIWYCSTNFNANSETPSKKTARHDMCVCFSLSKPGGGHRSLQSQSGTIGGRGSRERRLSLLVSLQMGEAKGLGHFAACILWGRGRKMFDGRFVVIVFIFNTLED